MLLGPDYRVCFFWRKMQNNFDAHSTEYDEWFFENDKLFDAEYEAVKSLLDADKTYIEIGVGTGIFASRLGIKEGVDPSENMARFAIGRGITVKKACADNLPYADGEAEGLLMITVDCFIEDILPSFREAYRVLKNGGSMVVAFIDAATPLGKQYEEFKETSVYYKGAHFRSFERMKSLLEEAGFEYVCSKQTVFTLDNVPQQIQNGHGEGVFAVIKVKKEI